MAIVSLQDPAVQSYIFYSSILVIKLLFMMLLTGRQRFRKKVFSNPEDLSLEKGSKVKFDDPDVERVRRAHQNDLENIPAFWVMAALYLTTAPEAWRAALLFRAFTAGRIVHTFVYAIMPLPQPTRAIAFFVPFLVTMYMAIKVALHYAFAM